MTDEKNERYVDPNSGAAQQPGGYVAGPDKTPAAHEYAQPAPEPDAPEADEEESTEEVEEETPQTEQEPATEEETGAQDYTELLAKTVPEVQAYLDEHPDELEAVKAAEQAGDARKGVLEYEVNQGA